MKVLWLINTIMPEVAAYLQIPTNPLGGWMVSQMDRLRQMDSLQIDVVSVDVNRLVKERIDMQSKNVHYVVIPYQRGGYEKVFTALLYERQPDVIHIWGTEYRHTLDMLSVCESQKTVVSIQGLKLIYAVHYQDALIRKINIFSWLRKCLTLIGRAEDISMMQKRFAADGKREKKALKLAKNVVGRTNWDYACVTQMNPVLRYFHIGELLREEFYDREWRLSDCRRHSVLLSQASYPIKGLHSILNALPILISKFPDTMLYIAGFSPVCHKHGALGDFLFEYQDILKKLICKYHLQDHIKFIGEQNAGEMRQQYLKAHVFLSCSTIENSPNSVCEAQMLGVPVVSSLVGGVGDLVVQGETGFVYPVLEPNMAVYYIAKIFEQDTLAHALSEAECAVARQRHNRDYITQQWVQLYQHLKVQ